MGNVSSRRISIIAEIYEALFSLNMSLWLVSIVFLGRPQLSLPFIRLEIYTKRAFHIQQTDVVSGYIEFAIPTLIVALVMMAVLRAIRYNRFSKPLLTWIAGVAIVSAPPLFSLYLSQRYDWAFASFSLVRVLEFAVAVFMVILYLLGRFGRSQLWILAVGATHFLFWFWVGVKVHLANYAGPIASLLGVGSFLFWTLYVKESRKRPKLAEPRQ